MKCPECGANVPKKTRFCTCCGAPIIENITNLQGINNAGPVIPPIKQVKNQAGAQPNQNQMPQGNNIPVYGQNQNIPQNPNEFMATGMNQKKPGKQTKGWLIVSISVLAAVAIALAVCAAMGLFGDNKNTGNNNSQSVYIPSTVVSETKIYETKPAPTDPPVEKITVPDVVGMSKSDAIDKITNSGLIYSVSEADSDTVPKGFVVSQYPVSGNSIEKGSTVTIYVSNKKETATTPPADNKTYLYCRASDFATLRTGPSRSNAEIVKIKSREKVEMLGTDGEFYYVSYNGKKGYVLKDFFSTDKNAPLNYGTGNP